MANTNLKEHVLPMDQDRGYPENKFYDNIEDFSIRSFSYDSNDTKRDPLVMLCSLFPIKDSSGYLLLTLQVFYKSFGIPRRVTQSQKVHISSHNGL